MKEGTNTVLDLERKVESLRDQLRCAQVSLEAAKLKISPIKLGDIVISYGKRWRVAEISARYWYPSHSGCGQGLELHGNKQTKNGDWGKGVFRIYGSWKLETPQTDRWVTFEAALKAGEKAAHAQTMQAVATQEQPSTVVEKQPSGELD